MIWVQFVPELQTNGVDDELYCGRTMSLDGENDQSIIGELSNHLAIHAKNAIIRCLVKIKNDSKVFDRFIRDGGMDILTKLLKFQNTKILDITLSILANAFLKSNVREENVYSKKIARSVVWIIKNLASGISLHCRACRLIGNMAESIVHAKALKEAGVVPALCDILNSKTNTQTLTMAVRAIRNIWTVMETSRNEILECGLVKYVTTVLLLYKSKFQADQTLIKYKELTDTCLKAMRAFSNTPDPRAGVQMKIKNDLCGFKCIVEYCKFGNRMSFQILYKLCRIADHRPNLGSVGAITCIVTLLEAQLSNNLKSSFSGEVIKSLCLFSREAINRSRIRDSGGLEMMLKLLRDVQYEIYHAVLLHALTQFVFDEESVAIMIKNGIVHVLVVRLKGMVLDNRLAIHKKNDINTSRKRTADDTVFTSNKISCNQVKHNRLNNGRYSLDFYSSEWSPSSISSACSSKSNSSPTLYTKFCVNDEDDNYSPVCSDDEDKIDEENVALHEEADSLKSYMSMNINKDDGGIEENDEELSGIDSMMELNGDHLPHLWTLNLLRKLTFWNDPIEALAHPTTIQALTAYIETSKNFRAPSILNRIVENHVYFLPLLLQGFVFEAQSLGNAAGYLRILGNIAESGGAFGELATILLRGQEAHKLMVAISVPFLLRSKDKLRMLLTDYGGLEFIFDVLANEKHLLNENSVLSLCQLANTLGIMPEKIERRSFSNDRSQHNEQLLINNEHRNSVYEESERKHTVTFELDDGETVDVCRQLLCIKSEVFHAMLEGRFFEAEQNKIRLRNVSREGFSMLCLIASGRLCGGNDNHNHGFKIEALLDAVLLADKFLMFDESEKLTETSISQLSHHNLSRAWNWARLNDCHDLTIFCVKNFLTSHYSRSDRITAFRNFAADKNFTDFLNDVRGIITSELLIR